MLSLHNLEKSKATHDRKTRRGRGNASGAGNYSGRGMKGQRSRSGGKSGLSIRSIKGYLLRVPKVRGFKAIRKPMATVNVGELDKNFNSGETVNDRAILKAGLITTLRHGVKILSEGSITKNMRIEANAFSASAKEKIEAAGGEAVVVGKKAKQEKKQEDKKEEKSVENPEQSRGKETKK